MRLTKKDVVVGYSISPAAAGVGSYGRPAYAYDRLRLYEQRHVSAPVSSNIVGRSQPSRPRGTCKSEIIARRATNTVGNYNDRSSTRGLRLQTRPTYRRRTRRLDGH